MSVDFELSERETQLLKLIEEGLVGVSHGNDNSRLLEQMKNILTLHSNLTFEARQWIKINQQLIELAKERTALNIKDVKMNYFNNYIEEIEKAQEKFLSNLNQKIEEAETTEGPDSVWVNRAKELKHEILSYTFFSERKSVYKSHVLNLKTQFDSMNQKWNKLIQEVETYGL